MTRTKLQESTLFLEGIRTGNNEIIKKIYEKYHKAIIHLVETHYGTMEDARDVFQESIMLIYTKSQSPDFKLRSNFFTFFYGVCRNIWSNKSKKKANQSLSLTKEITSNLTAETIIEIEQNEQYFLYRKKFQLLGEKCQKIMNLYFNKVKMIEIMKIMGHNSVGYTKKRKFLCQKKLIELIKNDSSFKELEN